MNKSEAPKGKHRNARKETSYKEESEDEDSVTRDFSKSEDDEWRDSGDETKKFETDHTNTQTKI